MIVITRARLKFLRGGRTLTIEDSSGRYRRGREYALGLTHRRSVCRVEVVDVTPETITIRLAQEPPRLLAARSEYGYTSDPMKALRDEGPCDAPPAEFVDHLAQLARANHAALRAQEVKREQDRSLAIRLKAALRADDVSELERIHSELERRIAAQGDEGLPSAQPARGADVLRSIGGRGSSYGLTAGSATA